MVNYILKQASLRNIAIARLSIRNVGVITTNGKTPPSLDEFDPLNPGEWQLGVDFFILNFLQFYLGWR